MGVPGNANALLLKQAAAAAGGYEISRSVRFSSSDSAYLSRTPGSLGDRKTWTWAGWVKRSALSSSLRDQLFSAYDSGSDAGSLEIRFGTNDALYISGFSTVWRETTQVFRDTSAWYHIIVAVDTTQGTANDRIKLYVNGSQVTTFATINNPSSSADLGVNTASAHAIGRWSYTTPEGYLSAYLADIHFIDGQALDPTSFGEFDTNGVWQPIDASGLTYGTNGFHLPFSDNSTAAALGTDTSSNSNTWTVNNISVTAGAGNDSLVDSPTNGSQTDTGVGGEVVGNYCTLNPLDIAGGGITGLVNGNLDQTTNDTVLASTFFFPSSGKWYFEATLLTAPTTNVLSISNPSRTLQIGYRDNGQKSINGSFSAYGASYTSGDVIGVAVDCDSSEVTFYKNNTSQGALAFSSSGIVAGNIKVDSYIFGGQLAFNFGQRQWAYAAPAGFKALCTTNLPEPTIADGSTVMDVALYTGNGSTQTISGLNFSPDLVWIKVRGNGVAQHVIYDSVRDAYKRLTPNGTTAEIDVNPYGVTAFSSTGFTVADIFNGNYEINGDPSGTYGTGGYVAWTWDAGSSTVTNTAGSITSQVRANASAGFSVVTYTGNGVNGATIGHGLGVKPALLICKRRDSTSNWQTYHNSLGATKYLTLNSTNASTTDSGAWNDTEPTSSVFSVGTFSDLNGNGATCVTYAFAPVAGYSAMGSYVGNGSSDGPLVFTGFRSRWVMVKRTDAAYGWYMYDTARDTYNIAGEVLLANASDAEVSDSDLDILSNGFKPRRSSNAFNASGGTFIYIAFAESPFAYARAR